MKRNTALCVLGLSLLLLGGCAQHQKKPADPTNTSGGSQAASNTADTSGSSQTASNTKDTTDNAQTASNTKDTSDGSQTASQGSGGNTKKEHDSGQKDRPKEERPAQNTAAEDTISAEDAETIALEHAGLDSDDLTYIKSKLDYDDGYQIYEVEFYTLDNIEYDYELDACTGELISYQYDIEHYRPSGSEADVKITAEDAKALALSQISGASESDIQKFKEEFDDGRTEYEGTIHYDNMKYEFEIDESGVIISWDAEKLRR